MSVAKIHTVNVSRLHRIEYWYDRHNRNWWAAKFNSRGNQIGDAEYAYRRNDISRIVQFMASDIRAHEKNNPPVNAPRVHPKRTLQDYAADRVSYGPARAELISNLPRYVGGFKGINSGDTTWLAELLLDAVEMENTK